MYSRVPGASFTTHIGPTSLTVIFGPSGPPIDEGTEISMS